MAKYQRNRWAQKKPTGPAEGTFTGTFAQLCQLRGAYGGVMSINPGVMLTQEDVLHVDASGLIRVTVGTATNAVVIGHCEPLQEEQ